PMGGDGDEVAATTIVFLVFSDPKQHLKSLSKMVKAIQSEEFLKALHAAGTVEDMQAVLEARLG
ncbi:MAG: PTS sugar transporter subunit IIA, partial [Corynebacterium sp.]|uniref:PTS sugar transporter subunit IIA n=1 Tax=Corynebacterium sp. TaxID=1720 RepID=UPI0017C4B9A5